MDRKGSKKGEGESKGGGGTEDGELKKKRFFGGKGAQEIYTTR